MRGALPRTEFPEAASLDALMGLLNGPEETDLVLLDLAMPDVKGFSGLLLLRSEHPDVPVIIVSATDDPATIRQAMHFGASGFVPKSQPVEQIREAVRRVLDGDVWTPPGFELGAVSDDPTRAVAARLATLTPQQIRVLMMLGEGLLNKQIAYKLTVSEATIKAHVSAILQKLDVDSRTQAVIAISKIDGSDWKRSSTL